MSEFILNFENTAGKGSFKTENFTYTDKLNLSNDAVINIPGSNAIARELIKTGSTYEIKRNGVIEISGKVTGITYLDGGGISARCKGFEFDGVKSKTSKKTYQATASATIFTEQITNFNVSYLGTIAAGVTLDFRVDAGSSYNNIFSNLRKKSDQDIVFDYTTQKINIEDHKGSQTSVLTLNDYIDINNLGYDFAEPLGNVITVYGKGDGVSQIISSPTSGRNTASITEFGEIEKTEIDRTIISQNEANELADVLAAKYGPELKTYRFSVNNPNQDIVSGDIITLNSPEKEIDNVEVRIVGIKRGVRLSVEFLELEVANKEYSELIRSTEKIVGDIRQDGVNNQTYMQGTTNVLTFSQQINATNTAPLRTQGNLPDEFIRDEAGNLRIQSFTCDYDVDPFRSSAGIASETDVAPDVNGSSGSTAPGVSGSSGLTPSIAYIAGGTFSNVSCSSGAWTSLDSVGLSDISGFELDELYSRYSIREISGGPEDVLIEVLNEETGESYGVTFIPDFGSSSIVDNMGSRGLGVGYLDNSITNDIILRIYPITGSITVSGDFNVGPDVHDHADGSYSADSHPHADGSYSADSHNHDVTIGDDVGDSGSINATSVNIYVDHWSGSAWIQKHSILSTGKTIDTDVDLSNGGTLPDAPGYWRTRITTDNASADLVNSVMKVKHELDT